MKVSRLMSMKKVLVLFAGMFLAGCYSVPQQVVNETKQALSDIPKQAKLAVDSSANNMTVSAHLLEGYPAEDNNPYVKGDYGTKGKLQRLVEKRICDIYRKIFTRVNLPDEEIHIFVQCRHGVRVTYIGDYSGTSDQAWTIYKTKLKSKEAKKYDWSRISNEEIKSIWRIVSNEIPCVQIQVVY